MASTSEYNVARWEYYFRQTPPYQVGFAFGKRIQGFPRPEWIVLDSACWNMTDGGATIAEQFQDGLHAACGKHTPPVISSPKGSGSIVTGKMLIHQALRYERDPDGSIRQWNRPKLLIHDDCPNLWRTLSTIPLDEKDPEKYDTDAEDHPVDGLRYWYLARTPKVETEEHESFSADIHAGFTTDGKRIKPWEIRPEEMGLAPVGGGRYQRPPQNGREGGFEW
jgi:hypothetical protein